MTVLRGLDQRLRLAKLYAFADARRVKDLTGYVRAISDGGADFIQVKLHGLTAGHRQAMFEELRDVVRANQTVLVIDGDLDVAAAAGADALLLARGHDLEQARGRLSRWALIGRHADGVDQLQDAQLEQARFAVVGPVVRDGRVGPELAPLATAVPPHDPALIPWFADGGITPDNVGQVLAAGARRIAVGTALMQAADPEATAQELSRAVGAAWKDDPTMAATIQSAYGQEPPPGQLLEVVDPESAGSTDLSMDSGE